MPTPDEIAQLEQTKMSFAEHLEELRRALFKSLLALAVGTLVGLMFGWQIVDYVQTPLRAALVRFYQRQSEAEELARLQQLQAAGVDVGDDLQAAAKELAQERLTPREFYLDPQDLARALESRFPETARQLSGEAAKKQADGDAKARDDAASADATPPFAMRREDFIRLPVYEPLEQDPRLRIVELGAEKPFVIYVKASLAAGLVLAAPLIFYFLWEFVAAGLYRHERKYVHFFLPVSLGLFLAGAAVAFYLAFGFVLDFLLQFFEWMRVDPDLRLSEWITFALLMPLGFGLSFQLPLVMLAVERIGLISVEAYRQKWRVAVVVIAFLAMVLSPGGDPYSMMLMGAPLVGLYFLGIAMCRYLPRGKA